MTEPRELTTDEVRERFIQHVWGMIHYWEHEDRQPAARDKLSGLAHSLLVAIDGCADGLPAFALAPVPHPDNKEFHRAEGENWFPSAGEVSHDIGGGLHEILYQHDPQRKPAKV